MEADVASVTVPRALDLAGQMWWLLGHLAKAKHKRWEGHSAHNDTKTKAAEAKEHHLPSSLPRHLQTPLDS